MLRASIINGVAYLEKPYLVDSMDFVFDHLDCDFIAKKFEGGTDKVYVIAFSTGKEHNCDLRKIFHMEGYDKDCIIIQGMDSQEVNCID